MTELLTFPDVVAVLLRIIAISASVIFVVIIVACVLVFVVIRCVTTLINTYSFNIKYVCFIECPDCTGSRKCYYLESYTHGIGYKEMVCNSAYSWGYLSCPYYHPHLPQLSTTAWSLNNSGKPTIPLSIVCYEMSSW